MRIDVQGLSIQLSGKPIVQDVTLTVEDGSFVGIIGPNGSGKSTLLKAIYRVLKPSGGAILLDGAPLDAMKVRQSARKMAVVSQHNFFNFDFAVREVVLMGRSPHKRGMERDNALDYQIVDASLEKVRMSDFADRSFSTLSGGEQQRVILARALAQQTPCLLLDEPTNHLDIKYQLQLMDIVKGLDVTVFSAIHDLNIAAMYCDSLYVIKDGRIVAHGTPGTLLTPAFIREIYEVDVQVYHDDSGLLHLLYHPQAQ